MYVNLQQPFILKGSQTQSQKHRWHRGAGPSRLSQRFGLDRVI